MLLYKYKYFKYKAMKKTLVASTILLTAFLVAGCSFGGTSNEPLVYDESVNDNSNEIVSDNPLLEKEEWVWIEMYSSDDEVIEPNNKGEFTISFKEDGSLSGTTDCNNYFGSYEADLEGNALSFGPLGATKMYCEGSQEYMFASYLERVDSYYLDNLGDLYLQMDIGVLLFR